MEVLKNNKVLVVVVILFVVIAGFFTLGSNDDSSISISSDSSAEEVVADDSVDKEQAASVDSANTNEICQAIDDSDVVVQLDLPEEYAHYNDENIFPSYETGFMFKSSYGDVASSRQLARKDCNYRVGFNKEDFTQLNLNPNYPLVVFAYKDNSNDFTYQNEPLKISLGANGLPEQGSEFILKVTGDTQSFGHFDTIFE